MDYSFIEAEKIGVVFVDGVQFGVFESNGLYFFELGELKSRLSGKSLNSVIPQNEKYAMKFRISDGSIRRKVLVTVTGVLVAFARLRDAKYLTDFLGKLNIALRGSAVEDAPEEDDNSECDV